MSEKWKDGPWIVIDDHPNHACLHIKPLGNDYFHEIASVYLVNPERDTRNAHLIAAAPDMYDLLAQGFSMMPTNYEDEEEWHNKVQEVLKKARGEE